MKYDVVILTEKRYLSEKYSDEYSSNVLIEDNILKLALEKEGLSVSRTNWDNPDFDWTSTKSVIFRSIWDYFDRYEEFSAWLKKVQTLTQLFNPASLIHWNIDKHYLIDLANKNVNIVESYFIETGDKRSLKDCIQDSGWNKAVLKPVISGAARHTYVIDGDATKHQTIFQELIANEAMMLQPYLKSITTKGEVSHMVMGGKYTHSILKQVKEGDFRVQDDFGGSVHDYKASQVEISFAEHVVKQVNPIPVYARVDIVWDNNNQLAVSELEIIEPELWFRKNTEAANVLAKYLKSQLL